MGTCTMYESYFGVLIGNPKTEIPFWNVVMVVVGVYPVPSSIWRELRNKLTGNR